jgi:hypothetical protein
MDADETNRMLVEAQWGENMSRAIMGWTVGIEAFGSP